MDTYQLRMETGPTIGKIYELNKNELYIGRDLANEISINDPEVSRRHARIFLQGSNYVIEDLGSTNGTFINGQRLMGPYLLHAGETVVLGENVALRVEVIRVDQDATLAAGTKMPEPQYLPQALQQPAPQPYTPPAPAPQAYVQPTPVKSIPEPVYTPPVYAGQIPAQPDIEETPKRKFPVWLIILLAILLLCCLCIVLFVLLDQFNVITSTMWCNWLGPLFNLIKPGSC
jgi:pSer/pThr/pTyr-binding forkhead associated (FHA) protein